MPAVPVLVPAPSPPVLAQPYLTAAQFTAYPHWLDLDNLIPGGVAGVQTDTLTDVLLAASQWCDEVCENMRLGAHYVQGEQQTTSIGRRGRIRIRPRDIPIRQVIALSWGYDPSLLTADALPDSSMWFEDGRRVSFLPGGAPFAFNGPAIQFGPMMAPEATVYVNWSYAAGFPSTYITAPLTTSSTSVTLADPTCVMPGDVLRMYDPGVSEALTVAATYVPQVPTVPPTPTAVPIAASPANAHATGTGMNGMPRGLLQAVICHGVAMLMREDVADEVPRSRFGTQARTTARERGGAAGGLINDAEKLLARFSPTWRHP